MTITYVRGGSATADGTSTTIACTIATNDAGNMIVVGVGYPDAGSSSVTGVADNNGNTYAAATTETRNATQGYSEQLWYAYNINSKASSLTITATYNGSVTFRRINAAEYHSSVGAFSTDPKDGTVTGTGTGNGTAMATGSMTPSANNGVIIAMGTHGSGTVAAGSGYTLRQPSAGGTDTALVDHIQTTATAETAKCTGSTSGQWGITACAFKDVTSGGATVTPSVISLTTALPAPSVSGSARVTPAVISNVTTLPAVTVIAGGATVTPPTILTATTLPAPSVSGAARVTPSVISLTTALPTPVVSSVTPPPVELLIRAAFGTDPATDLSTLSDVDWTDITAYVRYEQGITVRAGRHGLGQTTDPLQMRLSLDDRDGRFTPNLNTGAYWPNILRFLPIQVQVSVEGGTPVELATAFIDTYEMGWDDSTNDCVMDITANGRLWQIGRRQVGPSSATTTTVTTTSPVALWPLTDGESASTAASGLSGGSPMVKSGSLHFGTGNGGSGQPKILDLAYFTGTPGKLRGTVPAGTTETSWRVESKQTWPTSGAAQGVLGWSTQGTIAFWQIGYDESTKALRLEYWPADGSSSTRVDSATAPNPGDRTARLYRVTADQSGANIAVVVSIDGTTHISTTVSTATLGRVKDMYVNPAYNNGSQMPAIGGVTVWAPYSSSVDTVAAASGYAGELAADRVQRLCDEAGVHVTVVAGNSTPMGIQGDGTLLEQLRECEAADGGILHDAGPDGSLVYIPRSHRYNRPVDMSLDVDLRHLSPGFRPTYDGRDLVTAMTVSQPDGTSGTYTADSNEGDQPRSLTLNISDDEDPVQHAAWRVNLGTTPGMRYPRVALDFRRSTDLRDIWLATGGIDLRIDVTNLPQQHSPVPVEQFVEGYEIALNTKRWTVACDCVPAEPYGVIILTTSAATLYTAVNATDTSWTSVVSAPPRWTTTDVPLSLACDGEDPIVATSIADVAITFVNAGATSNADNTSVTPSLPASVTTGDLLLVVAAIRSSGTGTVNAPSGYTLMAGWHNLAIFGKIHSGSESNPTVSFTGGSAGDTTSAAMLAFRNTVASAANCLVGWADWLNPSAQDIAYPPLRVPKYDGCALLAVGWKQDDWTSVATLSGWTEAVDTPSLTGNDQGLVVDYQIQTTATAIATGSFTVTGGASAISRGLLIAIAPGKSTLTVTRATNGTAISHSAGAAITASSPGRLAL